LIELVISNNILNQKWVYSGKSYFNPPTLQLS
jgi:hypothetical protein